MPGDNDQIDTELVAGVINATLRTMLHHLTNPPAGGVKASYLETTRRFLSDHGLFLDLLTPDKAEEAESFVERLKKLTEDEAEEPAQSSVDACAAHGD